MTRRWWWPWGRDPVPDPVAADAEARLVDLERRADQVERNLRDRMRRNNFADGLAVAWGVPVRRGRP